jgi:hypothetical protein
VNVLTLKTTTALKLNIVAEQDIRRTVLYAKIESVGDNDKKRSRASAVSTPWKSKGTKSCSLDNQYLDCALLDPKDWDCRPCPNGGYCGGSVTWDEIGPLFGWWKTPVNERTNRLETSSTFSNTSNDNQVVFLECLFPPACLGAANPNLISRYPEAVNTTAYISGSDFNCNVNLGFKNRSRLCHTCAEGYKRQGTNRCAKCPTNQGDNWFLMFLGAMLILSVVIALVYDAIETGGDAEESSSFLKIFLNFVQVMSLCGNFPLRWPTALEVMFEVQGAVSTLGEHLVNPDCVTASATAAELYYAKNRVFALMPVIILVVSFIFWFIVGFVYKKSFLHKRFNQNDRTPKDKFIVTVVNLLYLLYPTLCKNVFGIFDCKLIGGKSYLRADLEEECYYGNHLDAVYKLGIIQGCAYVVGLPLIVYIFLNRNSEHLQSPVTRARYGLFYRGYKTSRFYWETIITVRKVLIVALSVFGPELGPTKQALAAILLLLACIVTEIYGDPYVNNDLGLFEISGLLVAFLSMWCGLFIWELDEDSSFGVFLTIVVILTNSGNGLFGVKQIMKHKLIERKEKRIKQEAAEAAAGGQVIGKKKLSFFNGLGSLAAKKFGTKFGNKSSLQDGDVEMAPVNPVFARQSSRKKGTISDVELVNMRNMAGNPLYNPETKKEKNEFAEEAARVVSGSSRGKNKKFANKKQRRRTPGSSGAGKKGNRKRRKGNSRKEHATGKKQVKKIETTTSASPSSTEIQLTPVGGERQQRHPEMYDAEQHDAEVSKGSITINTDPTTGHRYSYNDTTGESIWLDAAADEADGEVDDMTISRDPTSGHRYSFNSKTGESIWLSEVDKSDNENSSSSSSSSSDDSE